jgi:hypothetical protein
MSRNKKKKAVQAPAPLRWAFPPGIPTSDFFEGRPLTEMWNLQEAVDNFVFLLEQGEFLVWEAVVSQEQGVPLTAKQEAALAGLLNFGDPEDEQILYINDMPRPSEPWYAILNKIVPHLLIEPFRTADTHQEVQCDGWERLMDALAEHGQGLSLPTGSASLWDVVPAQLRHKLRLQGCFDALSGLGQEEELTLQDEEELYRIEEFIDHLRRRKDTVAYFGLTLESLLTRVILPDRDRPIFSKLLKERLGLTSDQDRLADHLEKGAAP